MDGTLILTCLFFFNDTATTEIYTLSLHDALPIYRTWWSPARRSPRRTRRARPRCCRSEEHTSELQSPKDLVCRLLLGKKKEGVSDGLEEFSQRGGDDEQHAVLKD